MMAVARKYRLKVISRASICSRIKYWGVEARAYEPHGMRNANMFYDPLLYALINYEFTQSQSGAIAYELDLLSYR